MFVVLGQMAVTLGHGDRLVTQNVSDLSESRATHGKVTRRGMSEIVESEIFEVGFCSDQLPSMINLKKVLRIRADVGGEDQRVGIERSDFAPPAKSIQSDACQGNRAGLAIL